MLEQESGFRPDVVSGKTNSSAGARGIAQFMPATAKAMGVNPLDPLSAIDGAARLLREELDRFGGDMKMALTAYNAGSPAVLKYGGPIPGNAESQGYATGVLEKAYKYGDKSSLQQPGVQRINVVASPEVIQSAGADYAGSSTSAGPDNGKNACVWAINKALKTEGISPPWGNTNYVPKVKEVLDERGTPLPGPQPGAIVIMQDTGSPPYPHIGIVQADGNIISNSSSRRRFDWVATPQEYERYYGRPNLYYSM